MDLTIIGFVIAVVGIILQLADAFPEHRETRKVVVLLALGVFIGISASALLQARYNITGNVDKGFLLLYCLVGLAACFGTFAVIVSDEKRREVSLILAFCVGAVFLMSGMVIGIGSSTRNYSYSTDEILILADAAERRGQFQTAIERLEELDSRLEAQDAHRFIRKRIVRLQAAQSGIGLNKQR